MAERRTNMWPFDIAKKKREKEKKESEQRVKDFLAMTRRERKQPAYDNLVEEYPSQTTSAYIRAKGKL